MGQHKAPARRGSVLRGAAVGTSEVCVAGSLERALSSARSTAARSPSGERARRRESRGSAATSFPSHPWPPPLVGGKERGKEEGSLAMGRWQGCGHVRAALLLTTAGKGEGRAAVARRPSGRFGRRRSVDRKKGRGRK